MTTPTHQAPQLPGHPEPHILAWTALELRAIEAYGLTFHEAGRQEAEALRAALTDADVIAICQGMTPFDGLISLARRIERAHGIGGHEAHPPLTKEARTPLFNQLMLRAYKYANARVHSEAVQADFKNREREWSAASRDETHAHNALVGAVFDAVDRAIDAARKSAPVAGNGEQT